MTTKNDDTQRVCEAHDVGTLTKDADNSVANWCPECRERICLRCSKVAPESWMSGSCHDCYRIISRDNKARQAEYARKRELEKLADAWDEGATAGWKQSGEGFNAEYPDESTDGCSVDLSANPYRESNGVD